MVLFLPGIIMPAAVQYEPLLRALNGSVQPFLKELEIYAGDEPPPDYGLEQEVKAIARFADTNRLPSFDLVGYSGGGAIALAFTARYPERVKSLALSEPAVIPSQTWMHREAASHAAFAQAMTLPPAERMREFMRLQLKPGVPLPPPPSGPMPDWMAKRPAGVQALLRAFRSYDLDLDELRTFTKPVYLAIGSLSDSIEERKANFLRALLPDFRLEVYEGRHHFDAPQRAEPERFARALHQLWSHARTQEFGA
jgi:pimeloyl-ACP methyl ester carboxylesterase